MLGGIDQVRGLGRADGLWASVPESRGLRATWNHSARTDGADSPYGNAPGRGSGRTLYPDQLSACWLRIVHPSRAIIGRGKTTAPRQREGHAPHVSSQWLAHARGL